MATVYDSTYRLTARDVATALVLVERLNPILQSLDLRLGGIEDQSASIGEMEEALRSYGTDRVNATLAPVLAAINTAAGLGALLTATSGTAQEVGLGQREFVIPSPARGVFAPAAVLSIVADDDAGAAMLGRRLSWSSETGVLVVDVIAAGGTGAHTSWTISAAAAIENAGQVRTPAVGALTGATLAAQLAEIAAELAGRQPAAATLTALAGLGLVGDRALVTDAAGAPALAALSTIGKALLGAATEATAREAIGAAALNSPQFTGTPAAPTAPITADSNRIANVTMLRQAISSLVGSAPAALDTLGELANALNNNADLATSVTNALAGKQPLSGNLTALAGLTMSADRMPYFTGGGAATTGLTAAARALLAGTAVQLTASDDLDALADITGAYSWLGASAPAHAPVTAGLMWQNVRSATVKFQTVYSGATTLYRYFSGGAWQPWTRYYTAADIVGTVARASGVNTGAAFEAGTVSGSSYTRLASGLQICLSAPISVDADLLFDGAYVPTTPPTWTFPAGFSAVPVITAPGQTGNLGDVKGYAVSPSATGTGVAISCGRARSGVTVRLAAIGPWF